MGLALFRSGCALAAACAVLAAPAAQEPAEAGWTLKAALKQVDRAMKDLRGLTAEVRWDELLENRKVDGEGRVWVSLDGRFRGEVAGSNPRTVIVVPPSVHVYRPLQGTAETVFGFSNPDLLVQYVLVGFAPAGSALKKQYEVNLIREEDLDGRKTLLFTLAPKSEEVRAAVSSLMLWIDETSWLPAQQLIRHASSGMQVTVRYRDVTAQDVPAERFLPEWPEGTKLIRR